MTLVVTLGLSSSAALAEPETNFWRHLGTIDKREANDVLRHARKLYDGAQRPVAAKDDDKLRQRMLQEALGMLRHGLRRDPENRVMLELQAFVLEASGAIDQALAAYRHLFDRSHSIDMSAEACTRFGLFLTHLDKRDEAVVVLRRCLQFTWLSSHRSLGSFANTIAINLAHLYVRRGEMETALRLLEKQQKQGQHGLLSYALLVLYDQDEQHTRAYKTLERMQRSNERHLVRHLSNALSNVELVPHEERHYYMALLLEIRGSLPEAREEWLHYVRSGARASERARQHIADIDKLLNEQAKRRAPARKPFSPPPPPPFSFP